MKISKKKKLEIMDALALAMIETIIDKYPDYEQWGHPDTWDHDQKKDFDLVSIFEAKAARKIEDVLTK